MKKQIERLTNDDMRDNEANSYHTRGQMEQEAIGNLIGNLNVKLAANESNRADIEAQLQTAWNEVFQANTQLTNVVTQLEKSTDYSWDKYGEIVSWIRFDLSDYRDNLEYFKDYMREYHHVTVDSDSDCLAYSQGPCIVINEDGDVYDQDGDKFFVSKIDYRDDDGESDYVKRNELIESYMEKSGYFPGVFRSDRHGNVFHVNTTITKGTE